MFSGFDPHTKATVTSSTQVRTVKRERRLIRAAAALLIVSANIPANGDAQRTLRTPSWVRSGHCVVTGTNPLTIQLGGDVEIDCADKVAMVRCDGPNFVPIDIDAASACKDDALPFVAASSRQIEGADGAKTLVEWLKFKSDKSVALVSTRELPDRGGLLQIPDDDTYAVRFRRPGASPVTVFGDLIRRSPKWTLPRPHDGGEVVIRTIKSNVSPHAFELTGPIREQVLKESIDGVSISGLPPGEYSIVPEYRGGLTGHEWKAHVDEAETTFVSVPAEDVASIVVTAGPILCSAAQALEIARLDETRTIRTPVVSTSETTGCQWGVDGLPPGDYLASLQLFSGSIEAAPLTLRAQETVAAKLTDPAVTVSGHITFNREPVTTGTVTLIQSGGTERMTAVLDDHGFYRAFVRKAGAYHLGLSSTETGSKIMDAVFVDGENVLDWNLEGARVVVTVNGMIKSSDTIVSLQGRGGSTWTTAPKDPQREAVLTGMPLGPYTVFATEGDLASRRAEITITADQPERRVSVDLLDNSSVLMVRDALGQPFERARVITFPAPKPASTGPGEYSLRGVPAGVPIRILSEGYMPACILAPLNETVQVDLKFGQRTFVRFVGMNLTGIDVNTGMILGISGSNCPVLLSDFRPERQSIGGTPGFVFEHFPEIFELQHVSLVVGGQARSVQVVNGAVVVQ